MTPPEAPEVGNAATGTAPPAVSVCPPPTLTTLKKRADFLRAARARRQGTSGMMVQARQRPPQEIAGKGIRVGYTCSKKVGNAVARNRAKRRLREVARVVLPEQGRPGWDYVLIGRAHATAQRPLPDLIRDLERALIRLHAAK